MSLEFFKNDNQIFMSSLASSEMEMNFWCSATVQVKLLILLKKARPAEPQYKRNLKYQQVTACLLKCIDLYLNICVNKSDTFQFFQVANWLQISEYRELFLKNQ